MLVLQMGAASPVEKLPTKARPQGKKAAVVKKVGQKARPVPKKEMPTSKLLGSGVPKGMAMVPPPKMPAIRAQAPPPRVAQPRPPKMSTSRAPSLAVPPPVMLNLTVPAKAECRIDVAIGAPRKYRRSVAPDGQHGSMVAPFFTCNVQTQHEDSPTSPVTTSSVTTESISLSTMY